MYVSPLKRPHFVTPTADRHLQSDQPMVAYLWLVWYQANSKTSPKHWALAVTYELHERAYATFYEVCLLLTVCRIIRTHARKHVPPVFAEAEMLMTDHG